MTDYVLNGDCSGNVVYGFGGVDFYVIHQNTKLKLVYDFDTTNITLDNNTSSFLASALGENDTTITLREGDGQIFIAGMVCTLEEFDGDKNVIKREIIRINTVSGDTLLVTRGAGSTVMNDTASPKVLGNSSFSFGIGAKISAYFGKEAIKVSQNNIEIAKGNNYCIYSQTQTLNSCLNQNYDNWVDCLTCQIAKCCHGGDKGFGSGCDGNCTLSGKAYLCANREYQFDNLIINSGACVRFEGQGVPTIRVRHCFCNMGTIDLRGGTFVGACSKSDVYTGTSISNNADQVSYNAMCFGCGGSGANGGCNGGNATTGCGGDGGDAQNGCASVPATLASGYNGGNGAEGDSCARNGWACGSGGGGGGRYTGNGGNGGDGYSGSTSDNYSKDGGNGGKGGNGGIWGKGGNGGRNGVGYASGQGGDGGNGYIGGDGGGAVGGRDCMSHGYAGNGGNGIILGGTGGYSSKAMGTRGGKGGDAINNMYGLLLYACSVYNNSIIAQGGQGGAGGCNNMSKCYTAGGGNGGNGANGGCVIIGYYRGIRQGSVNVAGGSGGAGGSASGSENRGCPGTNGATGSCKICKMF